jgi:hypothetical protein
MMTMDPALFDKVISFREKDKKLIDGVMNDVIPLLSAENQQAMLEGKIGLLEESKAADKTIGVMKQMKGVSKDALKDFQNVSNQIKQYNFMPKVAEQLQQKIADFNDKVQTKDITDSKEVSAYVKVLKDEINKGIQTSNNEKYKQGITPAKNIDDTNAAYGDIKYLKDDGAIKTDKAGNINLAQAVNGKTLTDIINKTIDKNAAKNVPANPTLQDTAKKVFEAYGVKPSVDMNNPAQLSKFLGQMGADIKPNEMKNKATLEDVAQIVASADERWGAMQK